MRFDPNGGSPVPILGQPKAETIMLPMMVKVTAELHEKLLAWRKDTGLDGESLVAAILMRGLIAFNKEFPLPDERGNN